jgi:hypothetical protein
MTPGTYLRKRREAAGVAIETAAMMLAIRHARDMDIQWMVISERVALLTRQLTDGEADIHHIDVACARLLGEIVALDLDAYECILLGYLGCAVPTPTVCRECACSWDNPCDCGCSFTDADPELCTACADPEWPDAPLPETIENGRN